MTKTNEFLSKLSDDEKVVLFNVALNRSIDNQDAFEEELPLVINAFMVKKQGEEINKDPEPSFTIQPVELDMEPNDGLKPVDYNNIELYQIH